MTYSTYRFKAFLLSVYALLGATILLGQNCDNISFENADFTNWQGKWGVATANYFVDYTCPIAVNNIGTAGNLNNPNTQHAIITPAFNGGVDQLIPGLSIVSPFGNTHVARIGDFLSQTGNGQADNCTANGGGVPALGAELTYKIDVTPTNDLALMYYAIVLEDPAGHNPGENPYFLLKVLDPDGNSIECAEYLVEGDASIPGFKPQQASSGGRNRSLLWRDWTIISIPLDKYHGQQVTVSVTATDCGRWGHLGYAYIDLMCSNLDIVADVPYICGENTMTLTAPDGMQEYAWYKDSTVAPSPKLGSGQTFSTQDTGLFFCKMTPYSTAVGSCPFDVAFRVLQAPSDPNAAFEGLPNPACIDEEIQFTDMSTTEDGTPIVSWHWDFDDGGATSIQQNPTYTYSAAGTYDVLLIVESVDGCLDSIEHTIEVIPPVNFQIDEVDPLCSTDTAITLSVSPADTGRFIGIGVTVDGVFDPALALQKGTSPFTIYYVIENACAEIDSIEIVVNPKLEIEIDSIGEFCSDDPVQQLTANLPDGVWAGIGVTDTENGVFTPAVADSGLFEISYAISAHCGDTGYTHILVNPRRDPTFEDPGSFCTSDLPKQLIPTQMGGMWSGNGVDANGVFDPAAAGKGTHPITYTLPDPCGATLTQVAFVSDQLDATFTLPDSVCTDAGIINLNPLQPGGRWSGPGISNPAQAKFDPLAAGPGTHTIQYTFTGSCGDTTTENIVVILKKDASINPPPTLCPADNPIQLSAAMAGGTWSGTGITDATNGTFDPAISGTGTFTITYTIPNTGSMCGDVDQVNIVVQSKILADITPVPSVCDTTVPFQLIAANPNGIWSGVGITDATTGMFDPAVAGAGTHTIQYLIPGNCGDTSQINIVVNPKPLITINPIATLCFGTADIQLTADSANGVWSGMGVTPSGNFQAATLAPGTYLIKYTLGGTCPSDDTVQITIVPPITIDLDTLKNASCSYTCDGFIEVQASGGNPGSTFNHFWIPHTENGATTPRIIDLCSGTYTVNVTDNIGCSSTATYTITKPDPLAYDTNSSGEYCGRADGFAWVENIAGGTPPYRTDWGTVIQDTLYNLSTGTYSVTVLDDHNCLLTKTVEVDHTNGPTFFAKTDSVSCNGAEDGSALIDQIIGGTAPYRVTWVSNLDTIIGEKATGLHSGSITVTVVDANNCPASKTISILEPPRVTASINLPFDTICDGQTTTLIATANGGNGGPFTYYWAEDANLGIIDDDKITFDQTARVTVFARDIKGCLSNVVPAEVFELPPLELLVTENTVLCKNDNVTFYGAAQGGNGNYSITWPDGSIGFSNTIRAESNPFDTVTVMAVLTDGCSTPTDDHVWYSTLPIPDPDFEVTDREGCAPLIVNFQAQDLDPENHYHWDLGGINKVSPDQAGVRYEYESGLFDIYLAVTNKYGCTIDTTKYEYIWVHEVPVADFYWNPDEPTIAEPIVYFYDNTNIPIAQFHWEIINFDTDQTVFTSTKENPTYEVPQVKNAYWVEEAVVTEFGCRDTVRKLFKVEPEHIIYVPNSFTPTGDGLNDTFGPKHFGLNPDYYNFYVFDRWGELIFYTKDMNETWDGTVNGVDAKPDVYEWMVDCRPLGSLEQKKFVGMVVLVR